MNFEELKESYLEILKEINMETIYEDSIKDAETSKKIVENENLFNNNVTILSYLYGLVKRIDMELLIDKKKLSKITETTEYDNSIRNIMFYFDKPDYKEFLNKEEQIIVELYKDIEILNKIEELNKNIQIANTDTVSEEILLSIIENKTVKESKVTNGLEKAITILSNIYNIKYKYVVYIIEQNNYIDNIIKQLNIIETNKTTINKVYASIKKYAIERL